MQASQVTGDLAPRHFVVFVVSNEPWGPQRFIKHHFASELARQGARVFFCDPVGPWRPSNLWRRDFTQDPTEEGVTVIRYRHPIPSRLGPRLTTRINDWVIGRRLRRLTGSRRALLWQFDAFRFASNHLGPGSLKIYHVCDAYPGLPCDRRNAESADLIVCTSRLFADHYRLRYADRTVHVPHSIPPTSQESVTSERVDLLRERFGSYALFTGSLNDRIDVSLLQRLADEVPTLSLVLAGPVSGSTEFQAALARLTSRDNVFYEGVIPAERLSAYVAGARLCLSAYRFDEHTSLGPRTTLLKVMHYLAHRKPVVSSSPLEYIDLEGRGIYSCSTAEEYLDAIGRILDGKTCLDNEAVDAFLATKTYPQAIETIFGRLRCLTSAVSGPLVETERARESQAAQTG